MPIQSTYKDNRDSQDFNPPTLIVPEADPGLPVPVLMRIGKDTAVVLTAEDNVRAFGRCFEVGQIVELSKDVNEYITFHGSVTLEQ